MSLIRELKTEVFATNALTKNPESGTPTADGAYGVSVWPTMRGPHNSMVAVSTKVGPSLGTGLVVVDGAIDYSNSCPVFDEVGMCT